MTDVYWTTERLRSFLPSGAGREENLQEPKVITTAQVTIRSGRIRIRQASHYEMRKIFGELTRWDRLMEKLGMPWTKKEC
jgi:hypothetical protein